MTPHEELRRRRNTRAAVAVLIGLWLGVTLFQAPAWAFWTLFVITGLLVGEKIISQACSHAYTLGFNAATREYAIMTEKLLREQEAEIDKLKDQLAFYSS